MSVLIIGFSSARQLTRAEDFLYVLGIGNDHELKLQIWDGGSWQPAGNKYWDLGDTSKPYGKVPALYVQEFKV